jgi:O-Antigen ligase
LQAAAEGEGAPMFIASGGIFPHVKTVSKPAESIGNFFIALTFLSSFYVKFEPAVCDLMFFLSMIFFFRSGLRITPVVTPLFLCLLIYNVSGLVSYIQIVDDPYSSWQFVVTSFYMGLAGFFFAAYVAEDPEKRFQFIMKYYIWAATIASILGLAGYFHVAALASQFSNMGRIVSGFKDPNVFSTFLILPTVVLLQGLMLGKMRLSILNIACLLLLWVALFLAFSRGAWINFCVSTGMMIFLSLLNSPDQKQRAGIILKAVAAIAVIVLILVALLSIEETRNLFLDRFTLVKDYDVGETGRFGNQLNSIPMLLERPFGFGPLQFAVYFHQAPHNTFLNAFASFGWIGGMTFFTLVVLNFYVGLRTILVRSPFQASAIAVYSCLIAVTLQGVQIDTEHWRHLYWMIGILWGFFAAAMSHAGSGSLSNQFFSGWGASNEFPAPRRAWQLGQNKAHFAGKAGPVLAKFE